MATLALSAAGAGIGSLTGLGSSTGWQIGSVLGRVLFPSGEARGGGLSDLKISGSAYGQVIPRIFGTMRLGGNIIWAGPIEKEVVKSQGGKGGGFSNSRQDYIYRASFALALSHGEMGDVIKIWADGKLIYDAQGSDVKKQKDLQFRFYRGTNDQAPDSLISAALTAATTPAYRGICYLVFDSLDLSPYGNRLPNIEVLLTEAGVPDYPQSSGEVADYHPDQMVISDDGEYVYSYEVGGSGDVLRQINVRTLAIEAETVVGPDFPALPSSLPGLSIDRDGNLWAGTGYGTLPGRAIHKFGTKTLTVEAAASLPAGVGAVTYSRDIRPFESGLSFQVAGSQQSGQVVVFDPNLTVIGRAEGGALSCSGIARDKNECAWVVMSGNVAADPVSDVTIFKVSLAKEPSSTGSISYQALFDRTDIPAADLSAGTVANNVTELVCLLPKRQELVLKNNHRLLKWSLITREVTAVRDGDFSDLTSLAQINSDNALLFRSGPARVRYIDADNLQDMEEVDLSDFAGVVGFDGAAYDELTDSLIILRGGEAARKLRLRRVKGGAAPYADVIGKICDLAGLAAADRDVSAVTGEVGGYLMSGEGSLHSALSPLLSAARLDLCETGYQLKFLPKGGAVQCEIPADDLMTQPEFTRLQEAELPQRVSVRYLASDAGYLPGAQSATRADRPTRTMNGKNDTNLNFALAMSAEDAKNICVNSLKAAWQERDMIRFGLPLKYLLLDPSDRIRLTGAGYSQKIQISQSHLQTDLTQDMSGLGGVAAANIAAVTIADAGSGYTEPVLTRPQQTSLFLFGGSLLRDQDATGGTGSRLYYAFGAPDEKWTGAGLYQSGDNYRYDLVGSAEVSAAHGVAVGALAAVDYPWRTDRDNTLELEIIAGADRFESVSPSDLGTGRNSLLVGDEVIQFTQVNWISASRARLTGLLRGRRGTEAAIPHHKVGERCLLLEPESMRSLTLPLSAIGTRQYFKGVAAGELQEDIAPTVIIPTGGDLKPYAPVHLTADRGAAGIDIRWVRRGRGGGVSLSISPPVSEADERYELVFTSGSRSRSRFVTGARSIVYSLEDFNQDFGQSETVIPSLDLTIYQLSEAIGRGYPAGQEGI